MRTLHTLLLLSLAAAIPAGAQVGAAQSAQQRPETLTVTVSPPGAGGVVRFYIERTAGTVAVVGPDVRMPTSSRAMRGLLQARGPVRLAVDPGAVGLRLRSVSADEQLRVEHRTGDGNVLTAEGASITFVRGKEPAFQVFADRMQTRRAP